MIKFIKLSDYINSQYEQINSEFDYEKNDTQEYQQRLENFANEANIYITCLDKYISFNEGETVCIFGKDDNNIYYNITESKDIKKISEQTIQSKILFVYNNNNNWMTEDEFKMSNFKNEHLPDYCFDMKTEKFTII